MKTMFQALKLCLPITLMTFAIFNRSNLVIKPGWPMVLDMFLVAIACWGVTYSIFGKFSWNRSADIIMRVALAAVSFGMIFHPEDNLATILAVIVVPATFYGVIRHRKIAPPDAVVPQAQLVV